MKRRVGTKGSHRESRRVRRDMENCSEHGLGAAHRLWRVNADCKPHAYVIQAATGAPVIVPDYRRTILRPQSVRPVPEGRGEFEVVTRSW